MEMDFPVFSKGFLPSDSYGRLEVIDYGNPIECGGVLVNPGDLIFADYDGIVVIPYAIAEEVLAKAEQKANTENLVRDKLMEGKSVIEVYQKYEVM
jgi:4-hydroxy-4-methyl-2-oxoglutarate aldolase